MAKAQCVALILGLSVLSFAQLIPEGTQHDTGIVQEPEAFSGWQGNGTSEASLITHLP